MRWQSVLLLVLFGSAAGFAGANSPVDIYQFDSDAEKRRYHALIEEFRCPKCLNTNLAGSDAPIAQDLRRTVHRLVVIENLSDAEVRLYLQDRYGDFVLYDPPFSRQTWLIWLAPFGFVLLALGAMAQLLRRAGAQPQETLSATQKQRLKALLDDD
ncbi:MAG TPA: cytochrome c-type biogenesis protein CcmH [Gammaproteobacteria bacterium]|nr:cytochrome c-type biogenesis protein CcmH [Gammaproteobacteria bacterium]|tara:strand:+ start:8456 stop:8923 length:468 start_codon:yes stop_codon:yes gene_type:complete